MEKKENECMVKISVDTTELDLALEKTKQLVALMEKQQKLAASSSKDGMKKVRIPKPDPYDIAIVINIINLLLIFFCHIILPKYS